MVITSFNSNGRPIIVIMFVEYLFHRKEDEAKERRKTDRSKSPCIWDTNLSCVSDPTAVVIISFFLFHFFFFSLSKILFNITTMCYSCDNVVRENDLHYIPFNAAAISLKNGHIARLRCFTIVAEG